MSQNRSPLSPWTVVVTGPAGQEVTRAALRTNVPLTIGRAPDCAVMLGVMTVARRHGRIELVNNVPTYIGEPGSTGTMLDGDPVEGSTPLGERTLLEIAGYRFALKRERAAAPAPTPAKPTAAEWVDPAGATLLDRHISGVRLHRNDSAREKDLRAQKWEQDWKNLLAHAREIQARYSRHPRVLEFSVSKDDREVIVKLRDDSPRGYAYFCLSRAHPEGRYPEMQAVWLREVGQGDSNYSEPTRGFEELLSRIAPRLA